MCSSDLQNSWDARRTEAIRIMIRVRTLSAEQTAHLRAEVLPRLPEAPSERDVLEPLRHAVGPPIRVLEIADFGTFGLSGPHRADILGDGKEPSNFVNLVRNIGARGDMDHGGGTYGYGKMSLFASSLCSTIVLDSLAVEGQSTRRRLIGCHVGNEYADSAGQRFTGRHWWGVDPAGGLEPAPYVDPATDGRAEALSAGLGLPPRIGEETGTTVMIVLPDLDDQAIADMREALLWFFWPKMLVRDGNPPPIAFELWDGDAQIRLPPPDQFPPLDLYVEAYESLKRGDPGVREIRVGPGHRLTGKLAIRRGFRGDRSLAKDKGLIPRTSSAVALMRPVELVVRYLPGRPIGNDLEEWAGVFIADEAREIERAFAAAEPPAHDDWIPKSLPDRQQKMFVNMTLRRIGEAAEDIIFPRQPEVSADPNQPPLAQAAARLGQLLPTDPDRPVSSGSRSVRGSRRPWSIDPVQFVSLEPAGEEVDAIFLVLVSNASDEALRVVGTPGVVMDDRLTMETSTGGSGQVRIIDWRDGEGNLLGEGAAMLLEPRTQVAARARVRVPDLVAVGLSVTAAD